MSVKHDDEGRQRTRRPGSEPEEITLELPHGLEVRGVSWNHGAPGTPALALHGWMDNAASFAPMAPLLGGSPVVAVDLPGHGRSGWRPPGCSYHFVDYVRDVHDVARSLGWTRLDLIGHSMGAAIAGLFAGALPELVRKLVLIDGIGPRSTSPACAPALVAESLAERARRAARPPRTSASEDELVDRMLTARPWISRRACVELVGRCGAQVGEGWRFTHDPALRAPSLLRLSEEHVLAFLSGITAPTLLIRAEQGWPADESLLSARTAAIDDLTLLRLDGTHHLHMEQPVGIAGHLNAFLESE